MSLTVNEKAIDSNDVLMTLKLLIAVYIYVGTRFGRWDTADHDTRPNLGSNK